MGWGKKPAATLQPRTARPVSPAEIIQAKENAKPAPSALPRYALDHAPVEEVEEVDTRGIAVAMIEASREPPSDHAKAEAKWAQFKSKKGWVPETTAMILYEFVKEQKLFPQLVEFAKRRR